MRGEIAKGAAWMVLFRLLDRSVGLISTAVLARLLVPNDFGLVAMAMSVIAVIELATAFSFEVALIQMPKPRREHFDTAWTLNLLIGLGGAGVIALVASPAASYYGDPRLTLVMLAIGGGWLIAGFENIGPVNFRREMNFSAEFRLMATKRMVGFVITMASALIFRSYWALVVGMVSGRLVGVVLSYLMHPFRPKPSLACARELFRFSGWMLLNSLVSVAASRIPHFYVGRHFGAQSLGAYTIAAEIAQLAQTELIAPINRAMFPGYARLVNDMPLFRKTCIDATAAILMVALPVSVGIAVLAGPFVRLLLGAQWGETIPIIQVLALAATVSALTSNNISIYLALGRPYLATVTQAIRLVALGAGIALMHKSMGVIGVAYAELAAALVSMVVSLATLFIFTGVRPRAFVAALWRPLLASGLVGWAITVLVRPGFAVASPAAAMFDLLLGAAIGIALYPLLIALLWRLTGTQDAIEAQMFRRVLATYRERRAARLARLS
ncbi:MAG: lipopolysaccharide biosynthesis protein [Rubrivivax sp.]|nr:lipopolysaccharide biosynthesis protein [Rubrivivax sp.]